MTPVEHRLKVLLPYAMTSFAEYAAKLWPYLGQSSIKMPQGNLNNIAKSLGTYATRLTKKFWSNVEFSVGPLSPGNSFFSDNYWKVLNKNNNGQLNRVQCNADGNVTVKYVMPAMMSSLWSDSKGESSWIAKTPWLCSNEHHEMFIDGLLTHVEGIENADQYEQVKRHLLENTKLFMLIGIKDSQLWPQNSVEGRIPTIAQRVSREETSPIGNETVTACATKVQNEVIFKRMIPDLCDYQGPAVSETQMKEYFAYVTNGPVAHLFSDYMEAIAAFLNQESCSFTVRALQSEHTVNTVAQSATSPFFTKICADFPNSQASRHLFKNANTKADATYYATHFGRAVFNLVSICKNEQGEDTVYPFFVTKSSMANFGCNIRTDVNTITNINSYTDNLMYKPFANANPFAIEIDLQTSRKIHPVEFFAKNAALETEE